jgi:hypothetical protein
MSETPATASRRRWISIGETVGILALIISAISLWDSHQDRVETRAAANKVQPVAVAPLVLTARAEDEGDVLRLASPNPERVIQTQTILFPKALGIDAVDTVGNPRIEAGWFAAALREAVGDDRQPGRLPIGIITRYTDTSGAGAVEREDSAIYDIGHGWRSRLLQRDVPVLEGITLVSRGGKDLQARLDARWQRRSKAGKP